MNKRAVISGATKGVGKAIAYKLSALGYDLAIAARSEEDLSILKNELEEQFGNFVMVYPSDFSSKAGVQQFVDSVMEHWSSIDVLCNNIGVYGIGNISACTSEEMEQMMNTNFYSAFYLTQPFLASFKDQKKGHIINICSIVNRISRPEAAAYTISKDALYSFSKVLSQEMANYHVKVTAILPGSINTASWNGIDAPLEKFVQPEDIGNLVESLLNMSDHSYLDEVFVRPINHNY